MKSLTSPSPDAAAPGPLAAFARFVAFGGGLGVLSSLAVPLLAMLMPWALSNALITIAATVLATELHARYTFRTGRRAGWRRHWQSAGSAAAAYAATSVAVFALHALQPSPSTLTEQLVYLSASGLAGTGRFLILRLFVFAMGRDQGTKTRNTTQTTTILTSPPLATPRAPGVATATATVMAGTSIPCTTIPRPRRTSAHCTGLAAALSPSRRQQPPTASRRPTGRPPVSSKQALFRLVQGQSVTPCTAAAGTPPSPPPAGVPMEVGWSSPSWTFPLRLRRVDSSRLPGPPANSGLSHVVRPSAGRAVPWRVDLSTSRARSTSIDMKLLLVSGFLFPESQPAARPGTGDRQPH